MSENFWYFVKRFLTGLSKLNPTCPQETLEEKYIFLKKTLAVFIVFRKERKNFDLLAKFSGRVVQTVFDLSVGSFWEVFLKKIRYILSFLDTEQNLFGIQSQIFQQGRQKELSKLSIISGNWAKSFRPFVKKILQGYQNCILRAYRNILNEKNFLKKSIRIFKFFSQIEQKNFGFLSIFFRRSCQKCILRVHGNTSTINVFWKFLYDFNSFSDYDWKQTQH